MIWLLHTVLTRRWAQLGNYVYGHIGDYFDVLYVPMRSRQFVIMSIKGKYWDQNPLYDRLKHHQIDEFGSRNRVARRPKCTLTPLIKKAGLAPGLKLARSKGEFDQAAFSASSADRYTYPKSFATAS